MFPVPLPSNGWHLLLKYSAMSQYVFLLKEVLAVLLEYPNFVYYAAHCSLLLFHMRKDRHCIQFLSSFSACLRGAGDVVTVPASETSFQLLRRLVLTLPPFCL
jgi:hypothetical protein